MSNSNGINTNSIPINEIPIRVWELNENSTHYDRMIAAPSDSDLVKFWTGWSAIMLVTGVFTTFILIPLLLSPKVKKNPFNFYLIFLMVPDMLVAWICGFTCLSNAIAGHFTTPFMCMFQSFYMIASIGANSWLNLCVTRQLYKLLNSARLFQRYEMPSRNQVIKEALCCYAYALFLATLAMFPDAPGWPHKTRLTIGAACIPMDYDHKSTAFFYCVFFPLLFGIPLAYLCWVAYQIYKHDMMPPPGRRRLLSVYFFRLAAVFVIMWLPGLLFLFVTAAWLDPWVQWAGGAWSHLQGLVSALVSLLKPDIWNAVRDFWCCVHRVSSTTRDGEPAHTGPQHPASSLVTRRPWVNSSVYWSSLIGIGASARAGDRAKSRVSSYAEKDDELEAAGELVSQLDTRSNMLVSDESLMLQGDPGTTDDEDDEGPVLMSATMNVEADQQTEPAQAPAPFFGNGGDEEAPVGTIYIVPKKTLQDLD